MVSGHGRGHPARQLLPLQDIPAGTVIHNIELRPGKGGQMVRAAGAPRSWSPRKATTPW